MIVIKEMGPKTFGRIFTRENKWPKSTENRFRADTLDMLALGEGMTWLAVAYREGLYLGVTCCLEREGQYWGCTIVKAGHRREGLATKLLKFRGDNCPYDVIAKVGCTNLPSIKACLKAGMYLWKAEEADLELEYPDPDPVILYMKHRRS